jgi:hypothetical protein
MHHILLGAAAVVAVSSLEIMLDDAGEHIRPGATWTKAKGSCALAGHAGGFHHNNGIHSQESFATWNFSIAQDGCYWVEEFHPDTSACDFTLSTRVPVQINYCRGMHTAGLVDQSKMAGQWNKLIKLPFYTTHTAAIHISAAGLNFQADTTISSQMNVWAADAFRLTWDAENCHDESTESDEAVAPPEEETKVVEETAETKVVETSTAVPTDAKDGAAAESVISVGMTLNVDYQKLSTDDKDELKLKLRGTLAKGAGVDETAVFVELAQGSVKVHAEIRSPDADSAQSVIESMRASNVEEEVVEVANSIPGVEAAAQGELKVEGLEVKAKAPNAVEAAVAEQEQEGELPAPVLQALVDDADSKTVGSTLEPLSQCPATQSRMFQHDGLQKDRHAQATYHFDPPRDGCYIVEEMHPQLDQCKASANTKVHVHYCKGLKALGTVDQTANPGQWSFLAALPFFAGHIGNLTLSNAGTQPGTLAVFDKVRFTWSGKSCGKVESHPREAEVQLPVNLKVVADDQAEFGSTLKNLLAKSAGVSEKALRLIGLQSGRRLGQAPGRESIGSITASFVVFPSALDDPLAPPMNAVQAVKKLGNAVSKNADDFCALTGAESAGPCEVQFTDLGIAAPNVRPEHHKLPQSPQDETEETETTEECNYSCWGMNLMIGGGALFAIMVPMAYFAYKLFYAKKKDSDAATTEQFASVQSVEAVSMEEGKAVVQNKPAEEDNTSTLAPSSDKSEPSLNGDVEEDAKSNLSIIKALSAQEI